jgi:hypothetical protein
MKKETHLREGLKEKARKQKVKSVVLRLIVENSGQTCVKESIVEHLSQRTLYENVHKLAAFQPHRRKGGLVI